MRVVVQERAGNALKHLAKPDLSKTKAVAEMIASRAKVQAQENVRKMAVVTG